MGSTNAFDVDYTGNELYSIFSKDAADYFKKQVPGYNPDDATVEVVIQPESTPPTDQFYIKVTTTLANEVEYGISSTIKGERNYGYAAALNLITKDVLRKNKIGEAANLNTGNRKDITFSLGNVLKDKKDKSVISFIFSLIYEPGDDHK